MEQLYFVKNPRTVEDLTALHPLELERPYEICADVPLASIDYGNFITDFLADRQFLEDHAGQCSAQVPMKCIFVHQNNRTDGILVVPDAKRPAFVKYAAYLPAAK